MREFSVVNLNCARTESVDRELGPDRVPLDDL